MSDPSKQASIPLLMTVGAISLGSAALSRILQDSHAHGKIEECAKHASKHIDQWLHDWHSEFGKCIEIQFQDTLIKVSQKNPSLNQKKHF